MMMVFTLSNVVGQQPRASRASSKTIKFAAGETTVESQADRDHVTVKDEKGKIISESWCESGAFDAFFKLFTNLKSAVGRGDRTAVAKLINYPLAVNGNKRSTLRDQASLLKAYEKVFTPEVLNRIRISEPAAVFCRNGEGMLGEGVVWALVWRGAARITAINR
jgi:hypothetical protein